jgi:hypothetical protein
MDVRAGLDAIDISYGIMDSYFRNIQPYLAVSARWAVEDCIRRQSVKEESTKAIGSISGKACMRAKFDPSLDRRVVGAPHGWWQGKEELGLKAFDALADSGAPTIIV